LARFAATQSSTCWLSAAGIGNSAFRIYPAAITQPKLSTGDQANQLHHTESGATNLE
jgi:hypothetical protein